MRGEAPPSFLSLPCYLSIYLTNLTQTMRASHYASHCFQIDVGLATVSGMVDLRSLISFAQ